MGAIPRTLEPELVRGARGLLGWSQAKLAEQANVSRETVAHYEKGTRTMLPVIADALRAALERAGVEFIPVGAASPAGGGFGLRLRHRPEPEKQKRGGASTAS